MNRIQEAVQAAKHPVALTGAGISAPSGIPTFQGSWKGEPIRDFLSREYFQTHPVDFFELFISMVGWCDKSPNAAHLALAKMGLPIITQNIDGLHHKAGSSQILELHGSLRTVHCRRCGRTMPSANLARTLRPLYEKGSSARKAILQALQCPCGARIDTDVVLYGDAVREMEEAYALAEKTDLMLVVGTSLSTYPAAMLPEVAQGHGARVLMINDDCVKALEGI